MRPADAIPGTDAHRALEASVIGTATLCGVLAMLDRCPDGCVIEVGVYKGGTAWWLDHWAQERGRQCFLYDTFSGIPFKLEGVDSHAVGDFGDTSSDAVRALIPHATVVEGLFPDSIVPMPPVAFAHIDVDQYQSYLDTCRALEPLMAPGGIMWLDDPNCLRGAMQAVQELYGDRLEVDHDTSKLFVRF